MQRVWVQHQRHWRVGAAGMVIASLDAPLRAVDNDFRHCEPDENPTK